MRHLIRWTLIAVAVLALTNPDTRSRVANDAERVVTVVADAARDARTSVPTTVPVVTGAP